MKPANNNELGGAVDGGADFRLQPLLVGAPCRVLTLTVARLTAAAAASPLVSRGR